MRLMRKLLTRAWGGAGGLRRGFVAFLGRSGPTMQQEKVRGVLSAMFSVIFPTYIEMGCWAGLDICKGLQAAFLQAVLGELV